jgi:Delta3-Delta2-enoyl-CoA isomerase
MKMIRSGLSSLSGKFNATSVKCLATGLVRNQSTASKDLVLVDVNDKTGYATVTLNKPPVNSLNLELLSAFSQTLDALQNNKSRGMILTSVS